MKSPLTTTLAAILAVAAASPALAQPSYYDSNYQQRMRDWQAERDRYEAQRQAYEADRAAYDSRYSSSGRYYGDSRYAYRAADPYSSYRSSPCETRATSSDRRVAGTLIGALVGGAIGAGVASDKVQTEGAVLGAVVGGAIGNSIAANSNDRRYVANCDTRGYYYSYNQTYPYRESDYYRGRSSGRYDYNYYSRERCRLAVAPTDWNGRTDYRYVRVCPDGNGRYRITD